MIAVAMALTALLGSSNIFWLAAAFMVNLCIVQACRDNRVFN